jgi:ribosomal-protein-alanine N-acetyltransferase
MYIFQKSDPILSKFPRRRSRRIPMVAKDVFSHLPTLETDRLLLRMMGPGDVEDVFAYASDPEVARFVTWDHHASLEDSARYVEYMMGRHERGEVSEWGMDLREDGRLIGTCGFLGWSPPHARAEVAFALSRRYWNRGLMTEAVGRVVAFGFDRMGLNRVEARCLVDNVAARRVLEKAGMRREGTLREFVFFKGGFHDLHMYSLLKGERPSDVR